MASARDKSYEVCSNNAISLYGSDVLYPTVAADLVSDVWEPLLRDLLVAYEHAVEYKGKGHRLDVDSVFAWGGYTRAKAALDG